MEKKNDIVLNAVESSNVSALGYDEKTSRMAVQFKNGGMYHYEGVDPKTASGVMEAKSIGAAVHQTLVRGNFKYERLDKKVEK